MTDERTYSPDDIAAKLAAVKKRAQGQKTAVPLAQYRERFAMADPLEICARTGVRYDAGAQTFVVWMLNHQLNVRWPELTAQFGRSGQVASENTHILLACYLLESRQSKGSGKMLAFQQLKNGSHYLAAFKRRCIDEIAREYGERINEFAADARALGREAAGSGDVSFDFEFVTGLVVRYTLWEGDDEFPANAQITFSDNANDIFSAEALAVVCEVILAALTSPDRATHPSR